MEATTAVPSQSISLFLIFQLTSLLGLLEGEGRGGEERVVKQCMTETSIVKQ